MFFFIVIILFAFFPIKLAKGLYLCPLTEKDRKKYLLTASYMRFGILMFIYGIVLFVSRMFIEASNIILLLQYMSGGLVIFIMILLNIHPGVGSIETAVQTYYSVHKLPVTIKPKIEKLNKRTAKLSIALLIAVFILGAAGLFLPMNKKELNPYLWFYYIPAFICSFICILIYCRKYLNETITIYANQEIYYYPKMKAGVFHAD